MYTLIHRNKFSQITFHTLLFKQMTISQGIYIYHYTLAGTLLLV